MIKVVFIDIDNTIIDFNKSAISAMNMAAFERGVELPDDIYTVYKSINGILWKAYERGEISMQDIFDRRWEVIFSKVGIEHDGKAFEADYRRFLSESAVTIEGAEELLDYLSERYTVCAASNGVLKQQINRLKCAGLYSYVNDVYTSDALGFQKPSKEFFVECLKRASCLLPEEKLPIWNGEAVMIGDSLTADINGIRKYGIEPIWFNFDGSDQEPEDKECKIVSSLEEIMDIL